MEALASVGGLDRSALHSQLAAACQLVLHTARARDGRRYLSEVAVLHRVGDGTVAAVTAWQVDRGAGPGMAALRELLAARGRS